ncbi:MAG: deoxyguanosinetriphosphate triphosphohydrolase [Chloroflexi bacterium]|nr:deoxyguanosinetriphosphate triphosphohydrolase [Chloroflexota bacterium]
MNLDGVRNRLEARERCLSPFAMRSYDSAGRAVPEDPSPFRTEFQRDRDRIIHTNSFRRLKHKSQVFVAPIGDHYVTRLTHTLEVAQIGRTIARALNLNEDLVEAIGMGHDLGHTPFGHLGERVLNGLMPGGFHHSRHSVRIVERLEKDGRGLNLTREVVEGIRRHSKPQGTFLDPAAVDGMSLEAQIIRLSDAMAYLAHDIDDAIRAGVIGIEDLPAEAVLRLGRRHSERVNALVTDIIEASWSATGEASEAENPVITMSAELGEIVTGLRDWMFQKVYLPIGESPSGRAAIEIVGLLYNHYIEHPEAIPADFPRVADTPERLAADMVCGMTDGFALAQAESIRPGAFADAFSGRL